MSVNFPERSQEWFLKRGCPRYDELMTSQVCGGGRRDVRYWTKRSLLNHCARLESNLGPLLAFRENGWESETLEGAPSLFGPYAAQRVRVKLVPDGMNVADRRIVKLVEPGDLVVTADIPLAADVVAKGAEASWRTLYGRQHRRATCPAEHARPAPRRRPD